MIWKEVTFGSFLKERTDRFTPEQANKLGLKRIQKIDFNGNIYLSSITETNTNMILVKPGDLVISGINVAKGAVTVYEGKEDVLATIHYSTYEVNTNMVDKNYLKWFLLSDTFRETIIKQVKGGIKTEIKSKHFLPLKIKLPDIQVQKDIANKIKSIYLEYTLFNKLISESIDLITLLRQGILQDAVMGKLVPQDPNDEPASVLLERIKEEKERLIKEGKIKKEKPLPPISEDEIPYELPEGWEWVRLGEICYNFGQKKPDEKFTYIDVSSINKDRGIIKEDVNILNPQDAPSRARKIVRKGTVIYSTVRPYLLNTAIVDREFEYAPIVSTAFAVMHTFNQVYNKYLYYYLRSIPFIKFVESQMVGMAYPAISEGNLFRGPFPLPPLNEQKRIVEKVDQLMALCDELEKNIEQSKNDSELLMQSVLQEMFYAAN